MSGRLHFWINVLKLARRNVDAKTISALAEMGDRRAVPPLVKLLHRNNPTVRMSAARALGRLRDPRAVESLIGALGDAEYNVREAAASALGELGDPRAVEPLIGALGDISNVRTAAASALGVLGDSRAVMALKEQLTNNWPIIRGIAATALGKIGTPDAIAVLIEQLGDGQYSTIEIMSALGRLNDKRAVTPLLHYMGTPLVGASSAAWRTAAAKALYDLGETKWVDVIKGDEEDWDRLGSCGDPSAIHTLLLVLKNENSHRVDVAMAFEALQKLGASGEFFDDARIERQRIDAEAKRKEAELQELLNRAPHQCCILLEAAADWGRDIGYPSDWMKRSPQYNELRSIGEEVDRAAGYNGMARVIQMVRQSLRNGYLIDHFWDGIGHWRA